MKFPWQDPFVIILSARQMDKAIHRTLKKYGFTVEQLEEMEQNGDCSDIRARICMGLIKELR